MANVHSGLADEYRNSLHGVTCSVLRNVLVVSKIWQVSLRFSHGTHNLHFQSPQWHCWILAVLLIANAKATIIG